MPRTARPPSASRTELPPPLPPETRTVGQLVAEALRLYGRRFWRSLLLGLPPSALGLATAGLGRLASAVVTAVVGGLLLSASYVGASAIAGNVPYGRRWWTALAAGWLVFLPFPVLVLFFVLPGLAWLALFGLVVPVVVLERRGFRESFRRAFELGRADFVHALGGLATLAILAFLTQVALAIALQGQGEQTVRVATFVAGLVVSPLLFLGAALLYFDQAARVVSSAPRTKGKRRSDADLHHAHEPDGARRADAEVEPRPAPRGQP